MTLGRPGAYAYDIKQTKWMRERMLEMTFLKVIRFLAVCGIIGGFFRALMTPLALVWGMNSVPELVSGILGTMCMGMGMFGLYFVHIKEMGKLGFTAFLFHSVASFILMAMVFSTLVFAVHDPSILEANMPPLPIMIGGALMMPFLMLGMILFAITVLRTKVLSIVPAILLLASPVLNFLPVVSDYSPIIWGLAFMLFGIEVWKKTAKGKALTNLDVDGLPA
ncbi:hypothetical protein FE782_26080 [Paenibacillus antri]|uniref:Uncharacterized protein n=1 Tax=Paenibacillus antri TaxID=2582848 RepID=A0A5R9G8D5_9BACL|nr:hypothetical protein [Paenibacillus antri]TLS49324.1 hypothetical protein FE782_26080 [Paenibacillus antri]